MARRILLPVLILATLLALTSAGRAAGQPIQQTVKKRIFLPVVQLASPLPTPSTSTYMQVSDWTTMYNLGCKMGARDLALPGAQDSIVVLGFGQGWYENGSFGVLLFRVGTEWVFLNMSQVADAVRSYIYGYWVCSASDNQSQITVAIGMNSYGSYGSESTDEGVRREYAYQQGYQWAQMVHNVWQYTVANGYASQVTVTAAKDIEGGFNRPAVTIGWVQGFEAANAGRHPYYNYGSCDGCPIEAVPSWRHSGNGWSQGDVYYVSWDTPSAFPLPEIYLTTGYHAQQWQAISLYGSLYGRSSAMQFSGVMTQYQACQEKGGCAIEGSGGITYYMNNTPEQGWRQLFNALRTNTRTQQGYLRWMTDISWKYK